MTTVDIFIDYILRSNPITWFVIVWLSLYFIVTFSIFFARSLQLSKWNSRELASLESILMGAKDVRNDSVIKQFSSSNSPAMLDVCKNIAEKNSTIGLSWLSVIASTSPFIGLFGTVVSILETFGKLTTASSASISVIAPAISEALIVTAFGIFVAIPAYSFHIILKRKAFELTSLIQRQIDILNSRDKSQTDDRLG